MASPVTDFLLGFIALYIGTIIRTTDGTNVTWFEPPPVEVITDHNLVHYASNTTKLPLASTNVPLSWNFSLSSDLFFISLNLKLNGEDIGGVPPAGAGQPGMISPFGQRFSLNWIPSEKVTLTIFNVTADDNGTFACELNLFKGSANFWKSIIPVQVLVPPAITNISGNQTVTEGDTVTLNCEAAVGNPQPRISWTKVSDSSVVTFPLVISRQDQGYFRCIADNDFGNPATKDVFVTVHYKPDTVRLESNATENSDCSELLLVKFTCNVSDSNPPIIKYYLVGDDDGVTFSNSGMWIQPVSKGGKHVYSCLAQHVLENITSSNNVTLTVNVPASVQPITNVSVVEGGNVSLYCNTSGVPDPNVTWSGDVNKVIIGRWLNITNISRPADKRNNHLIYRCHANNTCGDASRVASIEVLFTPVVKLVRNDTRENICIGTIVNLTCKANANPPVDNYTLYKNNDVVVQRQEIMEIETFGLPGQYIYRCEANNSVGTGQSSDTILTVGVPASVQPITNKSVVEGGNVSFYCSASGVPDPNVTWSGDVNKVIIGRWLNITNISRPADKRNNHLIYRCHANNTCGDALRVASIEVLYPPVATVNETIKEPNGSDVVIRCDVSGNPPPDIFWYEGNNVSDGRLITRKKQFSIKVVSNETYICSANNSLGSVTARVDVVVVVVIKITFTIRDEDCNNFTEPSKERIRNETYERCKPLGIIAVKIRNTSCGSVIVDLELSFTQSVTVDQVVETLKNAASDFGGFNVDPESIRETGKAVSTTGAPTSAPTGAPTSATTETPCPESFIKKPDCSVNVVIVAVLVVVAVVVVAFVAGVIGWWIHKRRKCRKDPRIHHSESEVLHDQNDIEDGAYSRVNGGYADSGPPSANGTAQPKEAGSSNTDVPAEQAAAAPPAYAVVDKSKKKDKDKKNIPDYAVVDKSKKKKKKPDVEDPYAEVEDPKKDKDHKTADPSTHDYAMVDKSKKKKKETDENAYATVDKSKKSKKGQQKPKAPGEVLYADLGDFQPVQPLPTVSTSPEPLAPVKRPTPYQGTEYADITQFLRGNATLPEGQSSEMQPTYANAGGGQGAAANKENANTEGEGGGGDTEPKETPM